MGTSAVRSGAVLVGASAAYVLLAIVHTYPLIDHLGSHVPGRGLGDNVSFVWNLWWMREAFASPDRSFFTCSAIFAPLGASLVLHTHTALAAAIGATLLSRLSVVEAQNVIIVGSLALNGLAAYSLSLIVSRNRAASVLAGALFVVAPAVTTRLMGHFNLILAWPLVFGCAALIKWWRSPSWLTAAALALTAAMTLYADYYYLVFLALFAVAYAVTDLWHPEWHIQRRSARNASALWFVAAGVAFAAAITIGLTDRNELAIGTWRIAIRSTINVSTAGWLFVMAGVLTRWRFRMRSEWSLQELPGVILRRTIAPAVMLLILAAPLLLPALRDGLSGNYVTQTSSLKSSPAGVDLATTVLGPPFSAGGERVRRLYERLRIDPMESSAWMGVVPAILLLVAIRRRRTNQELRRWLAIAGVFFVWSLGPYLMLFGTNTGLLLPQAVARFVPILNNARIPGRAMVMVDASIAVLASLLLANMAKPRHIVAVVAVLVAILGVAESLAAPLSLAKLPDEGVYAAVASDRRPGAVLSIPFGVRDAFGNAGQFDHDALYEQTRHGHALAGGFLARVPDRILSWYESTEPYSTLLLLSRGAGVESWPSCQAIVKGLEAASVSYVVLYRANATPALVAFVRSRMPLTQQSEDAERTLFRVVRDACKSEN